MGKVGNTIGAIAAAGGTLVGGMAIESEVGLFSGEDITVETVGVDRVNNCARVVLDAAQDKFQILDNDPSTAADEAYDSTKLAEKDGQTFVDTEFDACVEEKFSERVEDFLDDLEKPQFTPVKEEK